MDAKIDCLKSTRRRKTNKFSLTQNKNKKKTHDDDDDVFKRVSMDNNIFLV